MTRQAALPTDQWQTDPVDPQELRAMLSAAHLAPSVHNTQPWRFVLTSVGIELHADTSRQLTRIDPDCRELIISCGAAMLNMRVAAAAMRRVVHVQLTPDAGDPSHLATLTFGARRRIPPADAELSPAIGRRHTHRRRFGNGVVAPQTLAAMVEQARREGVELLHVDERHRRTVARITRVANLTLAGDPEYRRELRAWTSARSRPAEGVPVTAFGTRPALGGPPLRDFALAMPWLERVTQHFGNEEWFVAITDADDIPAWLAAGQGMERVLLTATMAGLGASFMSQAFEVPPLRTELRRCLGVQGIPQILMRFGPASPRALSGRRPLDQVVTVGNGAAGLLLGRNDS
jgi:hypothetical protein